MAACVQKANQGDLGRWIPAKAANISEKLESVTEWFNFKGMTSINFDEDDPRQTLIKHKRFVMFTVCINDELLQLGHEVLSSLNDALINCLGKLKATDQVCFNVGNSSQLLASDWQKNIQHWGSVKDQFEKLQEMVKNTQSALVLQYLQTDENGNNNVILQNEST